MQYEIEPMYTLGIIAFNSFVYFLLPNDYYVEIWYGQNFFITAN